MHKGDCNQRIVLMSTKDVRFHMIPKEITIEAEVQSSNKNDEGCDLYYAGYVDDGTTKELCTEYLYSFLGSTTNAKD